MTIYADLIDKELVTEGRLLEEYLLTLYLAYIAEVRCYLELEEFDTAIRRFQERQEQINTCLKECINCLLTSNPLMYLHPNLKGKSDLSRMTKILQFFKPDLTENSCFELLRDCMVSECDLDEWIDSLPASIIEPENIQKGFFGGIQEDGIEKVFQKLSDALAKMESIIETNQRFAAYELEVKAISSLGISFYEWLKLQPSEPKNDRGNLMYIIPKEPLSLS